MSESPDTTDSMLDQTTGSPAGAAPEKEGTPFIISPQDGGVNPQSYIHQNSPPASKAGSPVGPSRAEDSDSVSSDVTSDTAVLIPQGLPKTTDLHTNSLATQGAVRCRMNSGTSDGTLETFKEKLNNAGKRRSCWSRWVTSGHCFLCSMGLIVFLGASSLAMYFLMEPFFNWQIRENLVLKDSLTKWIKPDEKPAFSVYLFDIVNPEEVLSEKAPIKLREVGPFVYRLTVEKVNITWNSNNTVSFRNRAYFHLDPELTNGSLDQNVTTVNLPLAGVIAQAGHTISRWMQFETENIFETRTVRELLWGYHSDVLKKVGSFGKYDILRLFPDVHDISPVFSLLKDQNGTDGQLMNIHTGGGDFELLGRVHSVDYVESLQHWATKEANQIRGTDGSMFLPFLQKFKDLTILYSQLFRTFDLQYQKPVDQSGINCYRYIIPDSEFDTENLMRGKPAPNDYDYNYDTSKENKSPEEIESVDLTFDDDDFLKTSEPTSTEATSKDLDSHETYSDSYEDSGETTGGYCVPDCLPKGMYSIQPFSKGVPMTVSLPHFLGADSFYTKNIRGLQPEESKHRTIFDVDKLTGVLINNRRRHQINIRLDDKRLSTNYIPLFWNDIAVSLTDENMSDLRLATFVDHIIRESRIYLLAFSTLCTVILIIASGIHCFCQRRQKQLGKSKGSYLVV